MVNLEPQPGPAFVIPVQGTNSWTDIPLRRAVGLDRLWWKPQSRFMQFLAARDVHHARPDWPFQWDTSLSGVFWTKADNRVWQDAGDKLRLWVLFHQVPYEQRNFIVHSHGGQVLLYAVAQGLEVRNVLMIGVPVREDMSYAASYARPRIQYWHSVYDPDDDTQRQGSWFDGTVQLRRAWPMGDAADAIKGIGHSGVLYDPAFWRIFDDNRWIDFLKLRAS